MKEKQEKVRLERLEADCEAKYIKNDVISYNETENMKKQEYDNRVKYFTQGLVN